MAGSERSAINTAKPDEAKIANNVNGATENFHREWMTSSSEKTPPSTPEEKAWFEKDIPWRSEWNTIQKDFDSTTANASQAIKDYGGAQKVRELIEKNTTTLLSAIDAFKLGQRGISGLDTPEKLAEEDRIRKAVKPLSTDTLKAAIRGNGSSEEKAILNEIFTGSERDMALTTADLQAKSNLIAKETLRFSSKLDKIGNEKNDGVARVLAEVSLTTLKKNDPLSFNEGPHSAELTGALQQSLRKEPIDLSDGKAAAIGYAQQAKDLRAKESQFTPVGSPADRNIVDHIALAQLANKEAAQAESDRLYNTSSKAWQNLRSDLGGALATLGVGYALNMAQNAIPYVQGLDNRIKLIPTIVGALTAGGIVNNYLRDNELLDYEGIGRNAFVSGMSVGAVKGFNALSELTVANSIAQPARIAGSIGIGATFGAGYKFMNIATGEQIEGANYRDPRQWGKEMGIAAIQTGGTAFILAKTIKSGGLLAESSLPSNIVGNAIKQLGPKEIASGAIVNGILFTQPAIEKFKGSYEANLYQRRSDTASKIIDNQEKIKTRMESQISLKK